MSNIDFQPLFDKINSLLNINVAMSMDFSGRKPRIICPNLVDHSGIFSAVFNEVTVDFFGYGNTDKGFWGTIDVFYEHIQGGTNGVELLSVWYNESTQEWTFKI